MEIPMAEIESLEILSYLVKTERHCQYTDTNDTVDQIEHNRPVSSHFESWK